MFVCRKKKVLQALMKIVTEQTTAGCFIVKDFIVIVVISSMPLKDWV